MKIIRGDYRDSTFKEGEFDGIITAGPTAGFGKPDFHSFMNKTFKDSKDYGFLIVFANMFDIPDLVAAGNEKGWILYAKQIWVRTPARHENIQFILFFGKLLIPPGQDELFTFWKGTVIPGYNRKGRHDIPSASGKGISFEEYEGKYSFPIFDEILDDQIHIDKDPKSKNKGQPKPQAEIQFEDGSIKTIWKFEKPEDFSWMFKQIVTGKIPSDDLRHAKRNAALVEKTILDPYMIHENKDNLLVAFPHSIGIRR